MKKAIISAISASALMFSTSALANPIFGTVTVQKGSGPVLNCNLKLTFDNPTSGQVLIELTEGDFGCETVVFNPNLEDPTYPTHDYTGPGNDFTVSNIYADTTITPGDCAGSLTATWNGTDWSIAGVLNEVVTSTGNCSVIGTVG